MLRLALVLSSVFCSLLGNAQTTLQATTSDALAVTLAQKSVVALTGGAPITDVTLNANVISVLGSENNVGTGTFKAKGNRETRVDLALAGGTRSDVRNIAAGFSGGAWETDGNAPKPYAIHNCWIDAPWFFPAFSALSQTTNSNYVFKYVGQEQHGTVNTQHIQVFQVNSDFPPAPQLSAMDFYLDPASFLPLALTFKTHPDTDMNIDISNAVNFANYQNVAGIQVPFHIQHMLNGSVILDITVTNAAVNTGLLDSLFTLP